MSAINQSRTKDHPVRGHQNRILREQRGCCFGVLIVVCVVQPEYFGWSVLKEGRKATVIEHQADLTSRDRWTGQQPMKIEIRPGGGNHHHDVVIDGMPYSRHYDLESAEAMCTKLISEQDWPISAASDVQPSRHVSRHLRRIQRPAV
jgi:hypothetical protein